MPPQQQPEPEPLAEEARALWRGATNPAPAAPPPQPSMPGLGAQLAQGLGRITQGTAHAAGSAPRAARSPTFGEATPASGVPPIAAPLYAQTSTPTPVNAPEPAPPPQPAYVAPLPKPVHAPPPAPAPTAPSPLPSAAAHPFPPRRSAEVLPPAHGVLGTRAAVMHPPHEPPHPEPTREVPPAPTAPPIMTPVMTPTAPPAAPQDAAAAPAAPPAFHGLFRKAAEQAEASGDAAKSTEPLKSLFRRLENPNAPSEKATAKKSSFLGRLRKRP